MLGFSLVRLATDVSRDIHGGIDAHTNKSQFLMQNVHESSLDRQSDFKDTVGYSTNNSRLAFLSVRPPWCDPRISLAISAPHEMARYVSLVITE